MYYASLCYQGLEPTCSSIYIVIVWHADRRTQIADEEAGIGVGVRVWYLCWGRARCKAQAAANEQESLMEKEMLHVHEYAEAIVCRCRDPSA